MHAIRKPYLLFLGDVGSDIFAKTAHGLKDWCPEDCVAQWRLPDCAVDLGLEELAPEAALAAGARSLVIAVAPIGGALPPHWVPAILAAIEAGLDIVSGMHGTLAAVPAIAEAARRRGVRLHDVRQPPAGIPIATGRKRTGKRLLMVGTDCALGKKYTALAITREMKRQGIDASFRATGQTGILIAGSGVPIDAVVSDFVAGAAEILSPDAPQDHWDVIEGQGSLFHPAYAAVTLGLIHGSQPDAMILCHEPGRMRINGYPDFPAPSLVTAIRHFEECARLTNPAARVIGVSLNTARLSPEQRSDAIEAAMDETGLPAFDPVASPIGDFVRGFAGALDHAA
ncbi:DUF1611 domain-containing protein [Erythrobacter sp. NE805]|uniref:DUF1611 domain-containing protein n=1 Tax=Erythrobacter sp. NE805 TaxID=3389875 RepID=UPI00396B3251